MKEKSQLSKILDYMRQHGSITPAQALSEFGCMRLAAQIFKLKRKGCLIHTETVDGKNRFGEPVRYARYVLIAEPGGSNAV